MTDEAVQRRKPKEPAVEESKLHVGIEQGKVFWSFDKPTAWFAMDSVWARAQAEKIIELCDILERKRGD